MKLDFEKGNGLVVAVVQDIDTRKVLMTGFMDEEAVAKTIKEKRVTFYSRTKKRLWTKGETSGNFLMVEHIQADCDQDALLIQVRPEGPTCHTGADTCWNEVNNGKAAFLDRLKMVIKERRNNPTDSSYTSSLFQKGINKVAQKVGEEAVELVIEAMDSKDELFKGEAADLLFHYLVLLEQKNVDLDEIISVLQSRHQAK